MPTLIVYSNSHGGTTAAVDLLAARLVGRVMSVDLKKNENPDPSNYEGVIVGGSVFAGQMPKRVRRYLEARSSLLKTKKLGLFTASLEEGEKAEQEFKAAFPADLVAHAAAKGYFGADIDIDKMNFLEKMAAKKAGLTDSVSKLKAEAIIAFAAVMSEGIESNDGL
ncbi:MAG: flavodoxin domain-containing protein [Acidobacteriota bacterium]|nr:flavodoxin domain-containing protein [Acidobacteriota bacterium]